MKRRSTKQPTDSQLSTGITFLYINILPLQQYKNWRLIVILEKRKFTAKDKKDQLIQKLAFENETNTKITISFQLGFKKICVQREETAERQRNIDPQEIALRVPRSKPITLGSLNSLKQGADNRLYNILDISTYKQLLSDIKIPPVKELKCNCSKSQCQKMYCDCFANGAICGEKCQCVSCLNVSVKNIKRDEPNYDLFCNCKKSKCQKNYCECFQNNMKCKDSCRCENCENQPQKSEVLHKEEPFQQGFRPYDEYSQQKSFSFMRPGLFFRTKDSQLSNNSFGYASRRLPQMDIEFTKQDSQGFN